MLITRSPSKQKGMALFISLIMLLLMSVIIVHGARSSTLELLLGNNAQHTARALMRAEDSAPCTNANAISSGPQAYYFNNAQQAAIDDGQIRREYSVTVALRNPT